MPRHRNWYCEGQEDTHTHTHTQIHTHKDTHLENANHRRSNVIKMYLTPGSIHAETQALVLWGTSRHCCPFMIVTHPPSEEPIINGEASTAKRSRENLHAEDSKREKNEETESYDVC